jgi:hypothetical protein
MTYSAIVRPVYSRQWGCLKDPTGDQAKCSRNEIFYSPVIKINGSSLDPRSLNPEDCANKFGKGQWGQACGGALRVGVYKIIVGYPGSNIVAPLPTADHSTLAELQVLHS